MSQDEREPLVHEDASDDEESISEEPAKKRKPYHYTATDDLSILKEVLVEKPSGFQSASKWRIIYDRLKLPVKDYKALKRRFDLLMKAYKDANWKSLRGSGLEEDYDEKLRLLTDIVEQMNDWEKEDLKPIIKKRKADDELHRAQVIRESAARNLCGIVESVDVSSPEEPLSETRSRRNSSDVLDIVQASEAREAENKKKMLELEQRRLEIMEQEIKLKENDIHNRLMEKRRVDMEERRMELEHKRAEAAMEQQSLLLSILQKKL